MKNYIIISIANCWFYRRVYEICVPPKWLSELSQQKEMGISSEKTLITTISIMDFEVANSNKGGGTPLRPVDLGDWGFPSLNIGRLEGAGYTNHDFLAAVVGCCGTNFHVQQIVKHMHICARHIVPPSQVPTRCMSVYTSMLCTYTLQLGQPSPTISSKTKKLRVCTYAQMSA